MAASDSMVPELGCRRALGEDKNQCNGSHQSIERGKNDEEPLHDPLAWEESN